MTLTASDLVRYYYFATNPAFVGFRARSVRALTVKLVPTKSESTATLQSFFNHWYRMIPFLDSLRELTLLGELTKEDARDILLGLSDSARLVKFVCESDALMNASWTSVVAQQDPEELGGFYNLMEGPIQPRATPSAFPNLRTLDTAVPFLRRMTVHNKNSVTITHLSVRMFRMQMQTTADFISDTLGDALVSLRVMRTFMEPLGDEKKRWFPRNLLYGTDSPMILCGILEAPHLTYLEVLDNLEGDCIVRVSAIIGRRGST